MPHPVTIGGQPVELAWTQEIEKRFQFRASAIGGAPRVSDFSNPKKAAAAITAFLWLVLPPAVHARFATPEDLFVAIDHETEAEAIHAALVRIMAEMQPDEEKKTSSKKLPSHG